MQTFAQTEEKHRAKFAQTPQILREDI